MYTYIYIFNGAQCLGKKSQQRLGFGFVIQSTTTTT